VSALIAAAALGLGACAYVPSAGPTTREVRDADNTTPAAAAAAIQIVDVNDAVARRLLAQRRQYLFSETLLAAESGAEVLGAGDVVTVDIWEAPPATLFGQPTFTAVPIAAGAAPQLAGAHPTTLPDQMIDADGYISVPFAGRIHAAGRTVLQVEEEIVERLHGKANQPEAMVRLTHNSSHNVTVVGEVTNSLRVPLTPSRERLLDALAAAGGVRQPVNKMTIQVTRGGAVQSLPLDTIIRDPRQNVPLQAGDVITAIFAPLSFTALGASGKNEEINFEAQGITLAQALARAGGLVDAQSDSRGVFIFRFEKQNALDWPHQPATTTPDGMVPVVYRVNLKDPGSFFVMQSFAMNDKDLMYVSDAPVAELQKFLNIVFSVVYPILNAKQTFGF
jgi:polysaccharide export outer membrane protein